MTGRKVSITVRFAHVLLFFSLFIDNAFGTDILPLQFILITIGIHLAAFITANGTALINDPRTDILRIVTDFHTFQPVAAMEYPAFDHIHTLRDHNMF